VPNLRLSMEENQKNKNACDCGGTLNQALVGFIGFVAGGFVGLRLFHNKWLTLTSAILFAFAFSEIAMGIEKKAKIKNVDGTRGLFIPILKKALLIGGVIIISTSLLIVLIANSPYGAIETMGPVFSILLGSVILACFIYLILGKDLFTIFAIIYLSLAWIGVPLYLLWMEYSLGAFTKMISKFVFSDLGYYELITSAPLVFLYEIRIRKSKQSLK
jgi:hypothetical protein